MDREFKMTGMGCAGLIALMILIGVLAYALSGKSKASTAPPTTTTTRSKACLHVSRATVQAIANGLDTNRGRLALRYDAVAVQVTKNLYAVTGRIVGPGMGVGGPTLATWITDGVARSPTIVWSEEPVAATFSQWGKAPYLYGGAGVGDVEKSQGCFPAGG